MEEAARRDRLEYKVVSSLTCELSYLAGRIEALSGRLADAESNHRAALDRNVKLEANCTALASMIVDLRREADECASTTSRLAEERDVEGERVAAELRVELRRATDDLERLACLVETERFEEERAKFLDDLDEKRIGEQRTVRVGLDGIAGRIASAPGRDEGGGAEDGTTGTGPRGGEGEGIVVDRGDGGDVGGHAAGTGGARC